MEITCFINFFNALLSALPRIVSVDQAYWIGSTIAQVVGAILGLLAIFIIFKTNLVRSERENIIGTFVSEVPRNALFLKALGNVFGVPDSIQPDEELYKRTLIRVVSDSNFRQSFYRKLDKEHISLIGTEIRKLATILIGLISDLNGFIERLNDNNRNELSSLKELSYYSSRYESIGDVISPDIIAELEWLLTDFEYHSSIISDHLYELLNFDYEEELAFIKFSIVETTFWALNRQSDIISNLDRYITYLNNALINVKTLGIDKSADIGIDDRERITKAVDGTMSLITYIHEYDAEHYVISNALKQYNALLAMFSNYYSAYKRYYEYIDRLLRSIKFEEQPIRNIVVPVTVLIVPIILSVAYLYYVDALLINNMITLLSYILGLVFVGAIIYTGAYIYSIAKR